MVLPEGWTAGWSAEHARPYYFNTALTQTQWHVPSKSTAAAADNVSPDVDLLSIKALKELISSGGLSSADCLDKAELRERARDAIAKMAAIESQQHHTDAPALAGNAAARGPHDSSSAESAISSALGFVDPIVHAVATRILHDQPSRSDAVARLRKHLADVDAVACAEALFGGGALCDSSEEEEEEQSDGKDALKHDIRQVAPWEMATLVTRSLSADLHAELLAFAEWVQPRTCEVRARSAIKRLVARELQTFGAGTSVAAYGSSQTGMGLFCSDVDLHFGPAAPLKEVASLLSDTRDRRGRRTFRDVDVLPSASVPIVAMSHAATRIEIDLSCATGRHDTEAPRLIAAAVARHAAMRPLALLVKVLLMQRALHETFTGGLGSFKLYVLLAAWLGEGEPPQQRGASRGGLGELLVSFLRTHSTGLGTEQVECRGVVADLSRVRVQEVMAAFAHAARQLEEHRRLAAVIDAHALQRMRERSLARAQAFTTALLAERAAGGDAHDGMSGGAGGDVGGDADGDAGGGADNGASAGGLGERVASHGQARAPAQARPSRGVDGPQKRPRPPAAADNANPRAGTTPRGSILDLVQFQ